MDAAQADRLVSIVIPVFNGANYLRGAIDSALAQTWPDTEIIVVDDGSNDGGRTRAIAESYGDRIRLISKANGGVATALNAGIAAARGTWFSWLSHDDLYHPRKVERQVRALLDAAPGTFGFGDVDVIDQQGNTLHRVELTRGYEPDKPLWALFEGRINGCAMMIPLAILREAGGFEPGLPSTQDYELWFRLVRRHPLIAIPGAFVRYRVHDAQGSRATRHHDEASLLWSEMLAALSPDEMIRHGGTEAGFLARAMRAVENGPYTGAAAAVERMLAERLRAVPITLLWAGDGTAGPARMRGTLVDVGLTVAECVVADRAADAAGSLALHRTAAPGERILRPLADTGLSSILEIALAAGTGSVLMLADRLTAVDGAVLRSGLTMIASGEADGWLPARGAPEPGPLPAAFRGALISRDTAAAALERCRRLGAGDAVRTLGLVGRMACPPGTPLVAAAAVAAAPVAAVTPPAPGEERKWAGFRPRLAATGAGAALLGASNWLHHRVPALRGRIGPGVAFMLGARGLVDGKAYLAANADIRAAGIDPWIHYLRYGWRSGLDPRPGEPAPAAATVPRDARPVAGTHPAAGRPPAPDAEGRPTRLLMLHTLGGGTLRLVELLAQRLRRNGKRVVFAWGIANREVAISRTAPGVEEWRFALPRGLDQAAAHLAALGIERVDVVHTMGLEQHIVALLERLGAPYDVTLTDYFLLATTPHIIDTAGPGEVAARFDDASAALALRRRAPHPVLVGAARRLACSRDLAARAQLMAPGLDVIAVRPPEPHSPEAFRVIPPVPPAGDAPLRVLLLGWLTAYKGGDRVIEAARLAGERKLPLEFHVLGSASPPVPLAIQRQAPLFLYGRFEENDLTRLVCGIAPHLAWFPADAMETYGFALSEAMLAGLPILARGMGAYPERLAGRAFTWVVPRSADASAEAWLARLLALRESGLACPAPPPMPEGLPPLDTHFYAERY